MTAREIRLLVEADPARLARALSLRPGKGGRWWCPLCQTGDGHKAAAVSFHHGWVKCFRCGLNGSPTRWVEVMFKVDWQTAQGIILSAYGLRNGIPMPTEIKTRCEAQAKAKRDRPKPTFSCLDMAASHAIVQLGDGWRLVQKWQYDEDTWQLRFQNGGEKDYRPAYRGADGKWRLTAPPAPRKLYRVDEAMNAEAETSA